MEREMLTPGQVHFFYTRVQGVKDPVLLEKYRTLSSDDEKKKIDRYRFEQDRHKCLVTRGLLRFVISRFTGIPPQELAFGETAHGKPYLISSPLPIQFNLSHSGSLTAVAVVLDHPIGIDIEDVNRKVDLKIADRFFSLQESNHLRLALERGQKDLFFSFWTLKESYIKAKGKGLSIPLNKFSFSLDENRTSITFEDPLDDTPENFTFFSFALAGHFQAAVTIESPCENLSSLTLYECIPFEKVEEQGCVPSSLPKKQPW